MAGNKNSGRRASFKDAIEVHFQMESGDVDSLNEIAEKLCKNNRSELILKTLKRLIERYESR